MKFMKKSFVMAFVLLCMFVLIPFHGSAAQKSTKLDKTKLTIIGGESKTLKATVTGPSKKVTWSSSNTAVATVDSNGKITAKKAGKTNIRAKANGKTATCVVTVKKESYKSLYRNFLAKNTVKAGSSKIEPNYFYVLNIDKRDVPELIIADRVDPYCTYYVYTVKNGKVKFLGDCTFRGAGIKPYIYYYPKKKAIYTSGWTNGAGMGTALHVVSGSKLKTKYSAWTGYDENYNTYYLIGSNGDKVSKSKYDKYLKQHFKNQTQKKYAMHENTKGNRDKKI